jgi:hypothetical protein
MAGDFFSEFGKWWQEGVEAGRNQPAFGPSVGRGLFSNWFLTERDREIGELVDLHACVEAMHDASPAGQDGATADLVSDILQRALAASDTQSSSALVFAAYDPIYDLVAEEFVWFPRYDEGGIASLDMLVRVELRAYLRRKQRLYAEFDKHLEDAKRELVDLLTVLFDQLASDELLEPVSEDGALSLNMTVAGLVPDLPSTVDQVLTTICSERQPLFRAELFTFVRTQLMRNIFLASGLNPNGPPSDRAFVMASQAKPMPAADLVDRYLEFTPFKALMDASLPISVPESVRSEHALILGGSGHGKTQLLLTLIENDLTDEREQAPGVIVIDSQGDLIETLARLSLFDPAAERALNDRLIIIDPADVEFPVALNLFAFDQNRLGGYSRADRQRVLNSVIDLYEYFFTALLGAELTQKQGVVFRYLARLMMEIPDATVQTLRELMEDGKPFKPYMAKLEGSARRFFETEFFSPGFAATKKQILRRLWGVLANEVFERMFSHPENKVDLFAAMNEGKIILINTAKDLLKAEGCSIFGRFFIAKVAQAALERATVSEEERRPVHVYIDEAHDYFDETLEQLFNQARKFRVGLHVAAQNLDQMPTRLRSTVMASTSLKFAGGVSAKDARLLADDMRTDADFIQATRKRRGRSEFATYVKNRTPSAIYVNVELGHIDALGAMGDEQFQLLMDQNRARYCVPLDEIEALIREEHVSEAPRGEPDRPDERDLSVTQPADVQTSPDPQDEQTRPSVFEHDDQRSAQADTVEAPHAGTSDRKEEIDRYVAGVGGREHTKWQKRVRSLGQERGFKATVEMAVLDGGGSVDVALERDELSIAVEVSISTDLEHELANAAKCVEAGFAEIYLLVPDPKKRSRFAQALTERLGGANARAVVAVGIEELTQALDQHAARLSTSEKTIRGYRVRTTYSAVSPGEAKFKRETIAKILTKSSRADDPLSER